MVRAYPVSLRVAPRVAGDDNKIAGLERLTRDALGRQNRRAAHSIGKTALERHA